MVPVVSGASLHCCDELLCISICASRSTASSVLGRLVADRTAYLISKLATSVGSNHFRGFSVCCIFWRSSFGISSGHSGLLFNFLVYLLVGCLTSQQHVSVSQGRICSDNFTCCHTEREAADQIFYPTQLQYDSTRKNLKASSGNRTPDLLLFEANALTTKPKRRSLIV